eukprot:CAMPEP_0114224634 /NCGR_PEP_ID=MMETSP0058-20121206/219_1 /TAXON_ID=36894 /ORGANISM="Pyramimonas parkeae, CCMP726" /LENGTH=471 /DNA_ID=CAMNT_0001335137 /DNA_START=27 /DNA_END=1442 /DNA_ORIENTATION=-
MVFPTPMSSSFGPPHVRLWVTASYQCRAKHSIESRTFARIFSRSNSFRRVLGCACVVPNRNLESAEGHEEEVSAFADLLQLASPTGNDYVQLGYGDFGRGLFLSQDVGQVLEYGSDQVDQWMAACQGTSSVKNEPSSPLLSLPMHLLLWVSDKAPYMFTPGAAECDELADLLRSKASWDLKLTAMMFWATRPPPASEASSHTISVQQLWHQYVPFLPSLQQMSHLLLFNDAEREELQDDELASYSVACQKLLDDWYCTYFAPEAPLGCLGASYEDIEWAMAIVRTRAFSLPLDKATCADLHATSEGKAGEERWDMLISAASPFADMLNHTVDASTTFQIKNSFFEIALCASRSAGAEADLCYMQNGSNADLMQTFGFSIPGNPNDRIKFPDASALPGGGLNKVELLRYMQVTKLGETSEMVFQADNRFLDTIGTTNSERALSVLKSLPFAPTQSSQEILQSKSFSVPSLQV